MPSGAAALPARELTDRGRPDATASRPTPAADSRLPFRPIFDPLWFHAREYHNTSRAVRQTSRKPRDDCESDTTPRRLLAERRHALVAGGSTAISMVVTCSGFAGQEDGLRTLYSRIGFSTLT